MTDSEKIFDDEEPEEVHPEDVPLTRAEQRIARSVRQRTRVTLVMLVASAILSSLLLIVFVIASGAARTQLDACAPAALIPAATVQSESPRIELPERMPTQRKK